jgi:2-amino-4-hydroxy-6-hydroxymethyldihydropteridine diphosphokinase
VLPVTTVYIGVGSNVERERHIAAGLDLLAQLDAGIQLSPVYESAAIGFRGDPFLNLVVALETALSVGELSTALRAIERANGHPGNLPKFSDRSLDLDILLYGDLCGDIDGVRLPRGDILKCAYVLWPLADLAPDLIHPLNGRPVSALRNDFPHAQQLARVPFIWRGTDLSSAKPR